jgi:RNA polymerase sigma factor (sigma-70 family)
MQGNAEGETLRQIRTLYATGAAGGLGDAQLVARFLDRDGADREDAFAALVQRHGPMVLAVCRRMLPGRRADADDAFQAVFLALARKAATLRRADRLKPWLHGAAVRTARDARRRSARLRDREGGSLDHEPPCPASDPDLFELRAVLDEELARLPGRLREPLLLCELEGASRQDAARRLGLPEGTLSSRLARGRSLLRDRLARRGLALGVGPLGIGRDGLATGGPPVAATARLALDFAVHGRAAGTVPAALAALAEGACTMTASSTIKAAAAALALACSIGLSAGLALGFGPRPGPAPAAVAPAEGETRPGAARGVVVDESGAAVAGAEVRFAAYSPLEVRAVSGPDGGFALAIPGGRVDSRPLLARTADGRKAGTSQYGYNLSRAEAAEPVRIVVKPARAVDVRVADANRAPIPGADVEAAGSADVLDRATTDASGAARLLLPPDALVSWVVARKKATGYDYAEFDGYDATGLNRVATTASRLPAEVALTLDAPRTVRVRALDAEGDPVAGVGFRVRPLHKDGREGMVIYVTSLNVETTDAAGVAVFDWLPRTQETSEFFPTTAGYANRRAVLAPDGETYVARLARNETIRGRATLPDGSPAADVLVAAEGSGLWDDRGQARARTEADGSYELEVAPDDAYAVCIRDEAWTAPTISNVLVRRGKPVEGVDFRLGKGTLIRGTVTLEPDGRAAAGEGVLLRALGEDPPQDLMIESVRRQIPERDRPIRTIPVPPSWLLGPHPPGKWVHATTDADGRYAVRVGPGTYSIKAGSTEGREETVVVADEAELVRDFRIRIRPSVKRAVIGGWVAGPDGRPAAGAAVRIFDEEGRAELGMFPLRTDVEGRFRASRTSGKGCLEARSADGSLAAFVELARGQRDVSVSLAPTASASGVLLDDVGRRAVDKVVSCWGRLIVAGEVKSGPTSIQSVRTDADGRFALSSLLVGWTYEFATTRGVDGVRLGAATPRSPGPFDLGTLRMRDLGK